MANELVAMGDLERMATAIAKSGLFGMKTPDQAIALMLVAQAEGLHPATAAMEYDIIQGRPARKSSAMLSRFQQSGGKMRYTERSDTRVAAIFSHPQGGEIEIDWTMDRAAKAGLSAKDNWRKWPRQMLSARVISEGVRAVFPGATGMFYEPGEVSDMVDVTPPKAKPAPAKPVPPPHDPETGEVLDADPFPKSDDIGAQPELANTTPAPAQTDEAARAETWAQEAIRRLNDADDLVAIDKFMEKNRARLAQVRAVNPDAGMAVVDAAEMRKRQIELTVPA